MKLGVFLLVLLLVAVVMFIGLLLLTGWGPPESEIVLKYVCSNGSTVEDADLCPIEPPINRDVLCAGYCEEIRPPEDTTTVEYIQGEIDSANYCDVNDDCGLIKRKCPFGCHVFVNKDEVDRINVLIDAHKQACVLNCSPLGNYDCVEGKCMEIIKEA